MSNDDKMARKMAADLGLPVEGPPVSKDAYRTSRDYGPTRRYDAPPGRTYRRGEQSSLWDDLEDRRDFGSTKRGGHGFGEWGEWLDADTKPAAKPTSGYQDKSAAGENVEAAGLEKSPIMSGKYRSMSELRFAEAALNQIEKALAGADVKGDEAVVMKEDLDKVANVLVRTMGELLEQSGLIWKSAEAMEFRGTMTAWVRKLLLHRDGNYKKIVEG